MISLGLRVVLVALTWYHYLCVCCRPEREHRRTNEDTMVWLVSGEFTLRRSLVNILRVRVDGVMRRCRRSRTGSEGEVDTRERSEVERVAMMS